MELRKRVLLTSIMESWWLLLPFFLWAVLVISFYAGKGGGPPASSPGPWYSLPLLRVPHGVDGRPALFIVLFDMDGPEISTTNQSPTRAECCLTCRI